MCAFDIRNLTIIVTLNTDDNVISAMNVDTFSFKAHQNRIDQKRSVIGNDLNDRVRAMKMLLFCERVQYRQLRFAAIVFF